MVPPLAWRELADPSVGFESPPIPERGRLERVRVDVDAARTLLTVADADGKRYDAVAQMPWGGFALHPFAIRVLPLE